MRFTFVLVTKYYLDHNLKKVYIEGATPTENIINSYESLMKVTWKEETSYRFYEKTEELQYNDL